MVVRFSLTKKFVYGHERPVANSKACCTALRPLRTRNAVDRNMNVSIQRRKRTAASRRTLQATQKKHKQLLNYIKMKESEEIIQALLKFRNERDWEQFHNAKDLALAISIESAELLELFLWKKADEANTEKVKEELADIFSFAFLLAEKYGFDVKEIVLDKIKTNGEKYPVDKAKGSAKKYNEL